MTGEIDPNRHIKDYLAYYLSFVEPPGYAVLINGAWGIGKTYLVKKLLKEKFGEKPDYVYISLYGLESIDDVDNALLQAMYPALGLKGVHLAGRVAKTALKFFRADPDLKAIDVLDVKNKSLLYVFDDLERCNMPVDKILGYINEFVEQDGCKVIILANENELRNQDEYRRRREKLIGKTLQAQSAVNDALGHFISTTKSEAIRTFLKSNTREVLWVYESSGLDNLRILQQTIWDFQRLFEVLLPEHQKNDRGLVVLLRLFFAWSFELKSGRLQAADLSSRVDKIVAAQISDRDKKEISPLTAATTRYSEIGLHDSVLSDGALHEMLVQGIVDSAHVADCLKGSEYFTAKADEPSWRAVWHAWLRPEDDFLVANDQMEKDFESRKFTRTGELLHMFGLRLWLTEVGEIAQSKPHVVKACKKYIDDVYSAGRLEPEAGIEPLGFRRGIYGLSVNDRETPEFHEIAKYLASKIEFALTDRYPAQVADLLKEMTEDTDLFSRRIRLMNSDDSIYSNVPLLASLDVELFVRTFLQLSPANQATVLHALKSRYDRGQLNKDLAIEKTWLRAVHKSLEVVTEKMRPFSRYRLRKQIEASKADVPGIDW